jgi:hypothetical protein
MLSPTIDFPGNPRASTLSYRLDNDTNNLNTPRVI